MSIYATTMIELVDSLIADARDGLVSMPVFNRQTNRRDIWFELAFCISSSQERTRRAKSAAKVLADAYDHLWASDDPLLTIQSSLAAGFISLRFMNRKSEHLAASWLRFREDGDRLVDVDQSFTSPVAAREYLVSEFPGIGPKQASMLLRNLGWGSDLAIIDSHVLRMSRLILGDGNEPQTYHSLEGRLREYAEQRHISLEKLDVILWSCSRVAKPFRIEEPALV